jgi:hypothetical protein
LSKAATSWILQDDISSTMDGYEGIVDVPFSLCCHSNTKVRASGIGVVDYTITRFGYLLAPRVPRLIADVNLSNDNMHGKFGLPSCSARTYVVDADPFDYLIYQPCTHTPSLSI